MACVRFRRGHWGVDSRDARGRRRWDIAATELEARKLLARMQAERRPARLPTEAVGITVDEFAAMWLDEVSVRTKETTSLRYRQLYARHLAPELGALELGSVSRFGLKRFLVRKHEGRNFPMIVKVLSMLFGTAYDDGLIASHPARRLKRVFRIEAERTPRLKSMSAGELARFLEASRTEPVFDGLFRTMAFSGLRPGEARALQVGDVDVGAELLTVARTFADDRLQSSPKSRKTRDVEIPTTLALELEGLVRFRETEAWVFHRRDRFLRAMAMHRAFQRIARRAQLVRHYTPHGLRHTYASLLLEQGARAEYVKRQLGHHSIGITVDLYGRGADFSDRPALERLAELATTLVVNEDEPERKETAKVLRFESSRAEACSHRKRTPCCPSDPDPKEPA